MLLVWFPTFRNHPRSLIRKRNQSLRVCHHLRLNRDLIKRIWSGIRTRVRKHQNAMEYVRRLIHYTMVLRFSLSLSFLDRDLILMINSFSEGEWSGAVSNLGNQISNMSVCLFSDRCSFIHTYIPPSISIQQDSVSFDYFIRRWKMDLKDVYC